MTGHRHNAPNRRSGTRSAAIRAFARSMGGTAGGKQPDGCTA